MATEFRAKELNNMKWMDREEWRRKIKLYAQNDKKN